MRRGTAVVAAALVLAVFSAYAPAVPGSFIGFDDSQYVSENPRVKEGLTAANLRWALTSFAAFNWHPLTWAAHMAVTGLFGHGPRGHHLLSILLHAANAVLLLVLLSRMTGRRGAAAFAAALFALHPLHVESVAWISELKDVLCAFFSLLALGAYLRYLRRPGAARLLAAAAAGALALAAKPMAVTLPFALLLLDFWPLGRWGRRPAGLLLLEKVPLLLPAAGASWLTLLAQGEGAMTSPEVIPPAARLGNAALSYVAYLRQAFWPADLAFFYPHPLDTLDRQAAWTAAALLLLASLAVLRALRRRPYLAAGWFFYLGTLVPVIGLVQVGLQARADRYTYLPLTGIFVMAAWGLSDLAAGRSRRGPVLGAGAAAVLAVLFLLTRAQAHLWRDNIRLFTHAVRVVPGNWLAHANLGLAYYLRGDLPAAADELHRSVSIYPNFPKGHYDLARVYRDQGLAREAAAQLAKAVHLRPSYTAARLQLGIVLLQEGRHEEARRHLAEAVRQDPGNATALFNLGDALAALGRGEEAADRYREGLRITPGYAAGHNILGAMLAVRGLPEEGIASYRRALEADPGMVEAWSNLGGALVQAGRPAEAEAAMRQALKLRPDFTRAHYILGLLLERQGRGAEAAVHYREARRLGLGGGRP